MPVDINGLLKDLHTISGWNPINFSGMITELREIMKPDPRFQKMRDIARDVVYGIR